MTQKCDPNPPAWSGGKSNLEDPTSVAVIAVIDYPNLGIPRVTTKSFGTIH
jgi:hypothetical protein